MSYYSEVFPCNLAQFGLSRLLARKHASRDLAYEDGGNAIVAIHRKGLDSDYRDVRREALAACRNKPKYELLDDLLKVADRDYQLQHVAIQALAFMDAPEAQRKVLESAQDEELDKASRIQAIMLLSRTNLTEAIGYLQELTIKEDREFKEYALKALDLLQQRRQAR